MQPGRRAGSQAILGAADQAALATAHFLLGVLVARLGGVASLGEFAFAYSMIVLVNMAHSAAIAEVYSIEPSVPDGLVRYGALPMVLVTALLVGFAVVALGGAGMFSAEIRERAWTPSFLLAVAASTCYWSVKPFFYRQSRPWVVLASTGIYAVVMLAVAWCGYAWRGGAWQPMWSIAAGAIAASVPMWRAMKWPDASCRLYMGRYIRATVRYSAWALPAAMLIWINSNGYMFTMPLWGDTAQSGGLRAVLNLVAPVNTLLVGACTAWLPMLAEANQCGDAAAYRRRIHRVAGGAFVITLAGAAVIAPASGWLLRHIYGGGYADFARALGMASLLPSLWVVASIYRAAVRAQAHVRQLFWVYASALVPVGLGLMVVLSPMGAAAAVRGMLATQLLVALGFVFVFTRKAGKGVGT